jgi:hypothetical protein
MSRGLKQLTDEMYGELGAFVKKGVKHKIWGWPLTLPYFTKLKKHTLVVECVDTKGGSPTSVDVEWEALKAKQSDGACANFKMWGKESANRNDKKYGLWVPPCGDDQEQQGGRGAYQWLKMRLLLGDSAHERRLQEGGGEENGGEDVDDVDTGTGTGSSSVRTLGSSFGLSGVKPPVFLALNLQKDMFHSEPLTMKKV